jgi:hypothetical protein
MLTPMSIATTPFDADLDEALIGAVERCRDALADYRAGLLDDHELRRVLMDAGLVRRDGELWLLDLETDRWWHYDGVAIGVHAESATRETFARLRNVINGLSGDAHASGSGENER